MLACANLGELDDLVTRAGAPLVLILDADNTLVPQGVEVQRFQQEVGAAIEHLEAQPMVEHVIVLTNGPDRGVPNLISRGNKPWTTRKRIGITKRGPPVWVVGDQVLTDGVLAWRLGATYLQLAIEQDNEAPRQAIMRRLGRAVSSLLFVSETPQRDGKMS